jgi:hypothetical protein
MLPAGASAPSRLTCPSAQSFTTYRAAVRRRGAGVSPAGPQPGFLVPTDSSSSSSAPVWFSAGPTSPHPGRRTTAAHAAASSGNCITTSSRSTDSSQGTHSPATTGGSSEEVLSSCSSADSFEDEQYEGTVQARERRQWAAQVRCVEQPSQSASANLDLQHASVIQSSCVCQPSWSDVSGLCLHDP